MPHTLKMSLTNLFSTKMILVDIKNINIFHTQFPIQQI
jgi:hypothetical protein